MKTSDSKTTEKAAPKRAHATDTAQSDAQRTIAVVHPIDEARAASGGVAAERVEAVIHEKHIGERIKHLRQRKGMGLVELGRHTGLSASFLSQLETGRVVPTLRNLSRIAMVFSRDISYFFAPKRDGLFRLQRASERQRLPQTGAVEPGYFFESLGVVPGDRGVVPYIAEFLPVTGSQMRRAHQHDGSEFLYVLCGTLEVQHGDRIEQFNEGDAVFFHAATTHSYRRVGGERCTAMILTLPEVGARQNRSADSVPVKKRLSAAS